MNDINRPRLKAPIVLLTLCVWFATPAALAGQAYGVLDVNGQARPPVLGEKVQTVTGARVSLHAAALANGQNFVVQDFQHNPAIQGADQRVFPLRLSGTAFSGPRYPQREPPPVPYTTIPKPLGPISTSQAQAVAAGTTSTARAVVAYSGGPDKDGNPVVNSNSTGTFAKVVTGRFGGSAAALVDDPIVYGSTPKGYTFSGSVGLAANPSGPSATLEGPGASVGFLIQGGANLPGATGELGKSDYGNPLIYSLAISFTSGDSSPSVLFNTDSQLQIFSPGTTTPITDADVENAIKSNFHEVGNDWSLNGPGVVNGQLSLFDYQATLSANVANFQVDDAQGVIAQVAPEPSTLTLAALGILSLVAARLRHYWSRRAA
jgi:hypothetical protein